MEAKQPYELGKEARQHLVNLCDNPFERESKDHCEWKAGWRRAHFENLLEELEQTHGA